MSTAVIIPARYASTRLPGKPLLDQTGKALILHVVDNAIRAKQVDHVLVATDDQRIFDVVKDAGHAVVMTAESHPNGTSRLAEAVEALDDVFDLIVNVQGDEPELSAGLIDDLVMLMEKDDAPMGTLATPFAPGADPSNPNIVKVVLNETGHAMYFSRSLIPYDRDDEGVIPLQHLGVYAYRRDFLIEYSGWPAGRLEQIEKLEQLRVLERGHKIAVLTREAHHAGIDTPEQYADFVGRWTARAD